MLSYSIAHIACPSTADDTQGLVHKGLKSDSTELFTEKSSPVNAIAGTFCVTVEFILPPESLTVEPYYLLLIDTDFIIQMSLALKHVTFLLNITFLLQKQNKKLYLPRILLFTLQTWLKFCGMRALWGNGWAEFLRLVGYCRGAGETSELCDPKCSR